MKENKDALKGKKAVKCEPVDWNNFKLGREEQTDKAAGNRKGSDKWAVEGTVEKKQSDKDFNEFVFRELSSEPSVPEKTGKESAAAVKKDAEKKDAEKKDVPAEKTGPDTAAKPKMKAASDNMDEPDKKPKKRKSLNTKLNEIGSSNWVSTGNFRNEEKISDQTIKELEDHIIETTKAAQDEVLSSAVKEVNKALKDDDGYEPLGEVSLADTFEIPELDIHFGDTEELKGIDKISREIKDKDLKKEIEKLDLAQSIEEQTAREIAEQDENERINRELNREKRRSGKSKGNRKKASEKTDNIHDENAEGTVKKRRKKTSSADADVREGSPAEETTKKARRKKAETGEDPDKIIIRSDELRTKKKKKRPAAAAEDGRSSEDRPRRKSSEDGTRKKGTQAKKSTGSKRSGQGSSVKSGTGKTSSGKKRTADGTLDVNRPVKRASDKKEGPSEFRKKAADWKDPGTVEQAEKISLFKQRKEALQKRIKNMTPIQWSMAAMALIIFITGIMTSAVYANYQGEQNKARALASLTQYTEDDSYAAATQTVTQEMLPDAVDEPEPVQAKALTLEMSSVEKDLKIKLVDDQDTLVKDVSWSVTVSKEGEDGTDTGESEVYEDDDRDGTIYINDIAAGEYAVTLNPSDSLADYILPQDKQLVSVKATIEYKVIANIRDEIKSEKEVNVALEDPNGNQAADVETGSALTDTVEWCESTRTENGEEYVEATPDITKTAASMKKSGMFAALEKIGRSGRMAVSGKSVLGLSMPAGYTVATEGGLSDNLVPIDDTNKDNKEDKKDEPLQPDDNLKNPSVKIRTEGDTTIPVDSNVTLIAETVDCPDGTSFSWEVSDMAVAVINPDGNRCTVTGKQPGKVTVKVICKKDDNSLAEASQEIVVKEKSDSDPSLSISGSNSVVINSNVILTATVTPKDTSISWSSSDESIASVYSTEDGGKKCTIKGIKAGSATITATASNGKSTTMTMTVKEADANYSDDAKLYDASKNLLYVKDGDNYRPATYGDYKGGIYSVFYRKQGSYLYTGWQNIDGKTYYYTSDHNYVTGEQVIQGVKYSFGSDGALATGSGTLGIDVSKYQPNINWSAVKASGVNYVIIRCGYRGASTGALIQDPYFTSHIKGAKAAGLKVGVYFFTTALTEAEAVEEASMCAELCSGYGINYPIFMDCENSPRPGYNSMSASERTTIIKAFCNTIKSAGYTPGVYANKTWLSSYINTSALSGCKIWLAQYNPAGPTYSGRYDLWQYTSKGHVDGISGNVDMNQSYLGY